MDDERSHHKEPHIHPSSDTTHLHLLLSIDAWLRENLDITQYSHNWSPEKIRWPSVSRIVKQCSKEKPNENGSQFYALDPGVFRDGR